MDENQFRIFMQELTSLRKSVQELVNVLKHTARKKEEDGKL